MDLDVLFSQIKAPPIILSSFLLGLPGPRGDLPLYGLVQPRSLAAGGERRAAASVPNAASPALRHLRRQSAPVEEILSQQVTKSVKACAHGDPFQGSRHLI